MKNYLFLLLIFVFLSCVSLPNFPQKDLIVYPGGEDYIQSDQLVLGYQNLDELVLFEEHPEYVESMLQGLFQKNGLVLQENLEGHPQIHIEISNRKIIQGLETFYSVSLVLRVTMDEEDIYQLTFAAERKKSIDSYAELYALLDKQIGELSKQMNRHLSSLGKGR